MALVVARALISQRDRVDRKAAQFKRYRFSRPTVVLETVGVERDIAVSDAVTDGLTIGADAAAEAARSVVGDIETAVGDRPSAVTSREAVG